MMLPMERSEVFKILSDIFRQDKIAGKMLLCNITMSESTREPYDIDFWYEESTCNPSDIDLLFDGTPSLVGYLHIVNPPKDCVDGEYCFVYTLSSSQQTGNIAIDSFGNIRVYGDDINSFIYKAIKDNANRLADYAKKLTQTYQHQVADTIVSVVKTYCETLMNKYANIFTKLDISTSEGCCTEFLIRAINEPERNCQFDVVKHIYDHNIIGNNIWVRFSKPNEWLWTPIIIKPSIGDIIINTEKCVFTEIFGEKEVAGLAWSICEQTGFSISLEAGSSTREQNAAKYITSLFQKHEVLNALKQVKEKDDCIGCDEVFQVVVDWLHAMSSFDRIKDVKNISHRDHTLSVSNSVGCGASKQYVTEELKVSYTPYMKSIMISLGKEHIITIDDLGLGDKFTCVYILKYDQRGIDDVLNRYLVACLAEVLKDQLGMDKLRAYTTVKCTQYTELTHNGPCFFNDDGKTVYVIDPDNVISNENINKNNKVNTILDMEAHIDSLVDKKLKKLVESGSLVYMMKDYLTDQILNQLKIDWHKAAYRSIYSSVWCTLAESRFKIAAYEFEKHFMEYVTLDYDDCFTVRFGLQKIDDNLPGIEIKFYTPTQDVYVRMLDHKSSGSATWSLPLIDLKSGSDESKVYFDTFKKTNCTYKSFIANVVSKIVLLEGLS